MTKIQRVHTYQLENFMHTFTESSHELQECGRAKQCFSSYFRLVTCTNFHSLPPAFIISFYLINVSDISCFALLSLQRGRDVFSMCTCVETTVRGHSLWPSELRVMRGFCAIHWFFTVCQNATPQVTGKYPTSPSRPAQPWLLPIVGYCGPLNWVWFSEYALFTSDV